MNAGLLNDRTFRKCFKAIVSYMGYFGSRYVGNDIQLLCGNILDHPVAKTFTLFLHHVSSHRQSWFGCYHDHFLFDSSICHVHIAELQQVYRKDGYQEKNWQSRHRMAQRQGFERNQLAQVGEGEIEGGDCIGGRLHLPPYPPKLESFGFYGGDFVL